MRRERRGENLQVEVYRFSCPGVWGSFLKHLLFLGLQEIIQVLKKTAISITNYDSMWKCFHAVDVIGAAGNQTEGWFYRRRLEKLILGRGLKFPGGHIGINSEAHEAGSSMNHILRSETTRYIAGIPSDLRRWNHRALESGPWKERVEKTSIKNTDKTVQRRWEEMRVNRTERKETFCFIISSCNSSISFSKMALWLGFGLRLLSQPLH